jgi:hypothetical protein
VCKISDLMGDNHVLNVVNDKIIDYFFKKIML